MSIFDTTLHIPAEAGLFDAGSSRALHRVSLPMVARPSWRMVVVAVLAAAIAVAALCVGIAFILSALRHGDNPVTILVGLVCVMTMIMPAGVALTLCFDLRRGSCLTIDGTGLHDTRLSEALPWTAVAEAEILTTGAGPCAVRLILREEGASRFNPCRPGGWSAAWRERRRERIVALLLLERRPYVLAQTIVALAARAGVHVGPSVAPFRGF
ncbi:hypothetical protein [Beijerinckia sp. L45]|uniref:hypothetical protein n=1 Tax=Beijerinckia sp. L45 TaxID=1641855 RepID=UPI00131D8433|nr:hypothetical protein [Beijerinckia sp. L45]